MTEETGRNQYNRRSFLRMAAAIGMSATAATLAGSLVSRKAQAATRIVNTHFVRRQGHSFVLGNTPFYASGTNNYYLHYGSHFMIDNVLKTVAAMRLSTIRTWGFLDGQPAGSIVMQPRPGVYPEDSYERFDYTVAQAGQLGLKLVVTLTNNWGNFGGMLQYIKWFGAKNHDEFYTNQKIKDAYKAYVKHFLYRCNRYTNRRMIDEPAIMTWELANEPRCPSDRTGTTLYNWVREMSSYIKGLDTNHMVACGDEGFYADQRNPDWMYNGGEGVDWKRIIALPTIDYATMHLYPDSWRRDLAWSVQWIKNHVRDAHALNKPVILEEFGWVDPKTRNSVYQTWLDTLNAAGGDGEQFWLLTGLDDDGKLYPNYDGYRINYPSNTANIMMTHANQMRSKLKIR